MKKIAFLVLLFIGITAGLLCAADIVSGLAGYWSFDEESGSTAFDGSGYDNNGTIYGATRVQGIAGRALKLDGTDDYVACGNSGSLNPGQAVTLVAWYKPLVSWSGSGNDPIIDKGFTSHTSPYYQYHLGVKGNLYKTSDSFHFSMAAATPEVDAISAGNPQWQPGKWYFLAGTYDGTAMKLYVNGILVASKQSAGMMTDYDKPLLIGKFANLNYYLNGLIDEVRVYNRALAPADIYELFESGIAASLRQGLAGWYSLDEGGGNVVFDASGNNVSGIIYGNPIWIDGVTGKALLFDGSCTYIHCGNSQFFNPQQQISLCAWYKPTVSFTGTGNDPIIDKGFSTHSSPYYQYHLGVTGDQYSNSGYFSFSGSAATPEFDSVRSGNSAWKTDSWYFLTYTYDGAVMRLYVNGSKVQEIAAAGPMTNYGKPLLIGKFNNLDAYLTGAVDEVRIYGRALDELEINYLMKTPVALRSLPYPYKAGLTLCSDIDLCSVGDFKKIHQFLNTREDTGRMYNGQPLHGIGLEIGDTFWMYNALYGTNDEFSYFTGTTTTKSENADLIRTLVHAGYLDCLHSFGDYSQVGGFTRQQGMAALNEMKKAQMEPRIFIDHGDTNNRDNVGYPTGGSRVYQMGDVPGQPEYHTDLSLFPAGPIRYLWKSDNTELTGSIPLVTTTLGDNRKIYSFPRYKAYRPYWSVNNLYQQLTDTTLDTLAASGKYMVIPTHLGAMTLDDFFSNNNIQALRNLSARHEAGEIYVTTTYKLLHYSFIHNHLVWNYSGDPQTGITIHISKVADEAFGDYVPTLTELQGITFYTESPIRTRVILAGTDVTDMMSVNPPDHTGMPSLSFPLIALPPWPVWTSDGYTWKTETFAAADSAYIISVRNIDTHKAAPILKYEGLLPFTISEVAVGSDFLIYVPDTGSVKLPELASGETLQDIRITQGKYNSSIPRLVSSSRPAIAVGSATYRSTEQKTSVILEGSGCTELLLEQLNQPFFPGVSTITAERRVTAGFTLNGRLPVATVGMAVRPSVLAVMVMIHTWETGGNGCKRWLENIPRDVAVDHQVWELTPAAGYNVLVDGNVVSTCVADAAGRILFTLSGLQGNLLVEIVPR